MAEQVISTQQAQGELLDQLLAPRPLLIAIEGGPCGGKSTLVKALGEAATEYSDDRVVVALPEAATEHINDLLAQGIDPMDLLTNDRDAWVAFEQRVLGTICANTEWFMQRYANTNAVGVTDRGTIKLYVTEEEYQQILRNMGIDRTPLDEADITIYLPSVASIDPQHYVKLQGTNSARYESSPEMAAAVCASNVEVVRSHPGLQMAWGGNFEQNIARLNRFIRHPETAGKLRYDVDAETAAKRLQAAELGGMVLNSMTIGETDHMLDGQAFRLRKSSGDDDVMHYRLVFTNTGTGHTEYRRLTRDQYELLRTASQVGEAALKIRHVVLEAPVSDGTRRLWHYDRNLDLDSDTWQLSTRVYDAEHAAEVEADLDLTAYRPIGRAGLIAGMVPRQGAVRA